MRTSVIGGGGAAGSGNPMGPVGGGVGGGFVPFRRASFSLRDVDDHAEAPPRHPRRASARAPWQCRDATCVLLSD